MTQEIPSDWDNDAHEYWKAGDRPNAIQTLIDKLNKSEGDKPKGLFMHLAYCLFFVNDYNSACTILQSAYQIYPNDKDILINLTISLSRAGQHKETVEAATKLLKQDPTLFAIWDVLAKTYFYLNKPEKAAKAGTNSLVIKDKKSGTPDKNWSLPNTSINSYTANKQNVIAFSLWGNQERYIYGALRNLLLAPDIYPDWKLWFYVDSSVSAGFIEIIQHLGGVVIKMPDNQSEREKLCWRFDVANHPDVGYFLVRDADSVFSLREANAVQEWLESDKWFHVIRDWWTHTDLILAGLWGGVSGVLPDLKELLKNYSSNAVHTPNVDQWFLRDCVWRYIKTSCLTHDRCFKLSNSIPVPGPTPKENIHIGSCEFHQRPDFQKAILLPWLAPAKTVDR